MDDKECTLDEVIVDDDIMKPCVKAAVHGVALIISALTVIGAFAVIGWLKSKARSDDWDSPESSFLGEE